MDNPKEVAPTGLAFKIVQFKVMRTCDVPLGSSVQE